MSIGMGIRLLETLTSALYEDPIVFFREYVQNSADAFIANPISSEFRIDISIDKEKKKIEFLDNGYGIQYSQFSDTMKSIGKSNKAKIHDQIGFRGIGRLSAMPFCKKLIFTNKVKGYSRLQCFEWNGEKYNHLLSTNEEDDLEKAIEKITTCKEEDYKGEKSDHFFRVEIIEYEIEIQELINQKDFLAKLTRLLPLKYSEEYIAHKTIHNHYKEFMGESLERFEFDVFLNEKPLYKPYNKDSILESDIVFWDLYFDQISENVPKERIGVLWFTFNRKVTSNPIGTPRGVFTRSKNMLLGNEYSIADAVTKSNSEYVATYRELTQTLNGLYGELLIDTPRLSDNARRDWFRIDASSNQLRIILVDFLKKLKTYRYAASQAFNDKKSKEKRKKVIAAYTNLTNGFDVTQFEKEVYANPNTSETIEENNEAQFLYANEDIPRRSVTIKKFYEEILIGLKNYFSDKGEEGIDAFIRVRTFLKEQLNK